MVKKRGEAPLLASCKSFQQRYEDAIMTYNMLFANASNTATPNEVMLCTFNGASLRNRVKNAIGDWESGGSKNDVEKIQSFISSVTERDLSLWKAAVKDRFENGKVADLFGQEFLITTTVP